MDFHMFLVAVVKVIDNELIENIEIIKLKTNGTLEI
jgi:hypothetical protein